MKEKRSTRVYSTEDGGRLCTNCKNPQADCLCQVFAQAEVKGNGTVRVSCESKGRKGKGVSLVSGLALSGDELKVLAKKLKQLCGSGGSVKNGIIEIQGDHRDKLVAELNKLNYLAKKSGG